MPVVEVKNLDPTEETTTLNLDKFIREEHYRQNIYPGAMTGTAEFDKTGQDAGFVRFLDSTSSTMDFTFPRRYFWTNGYFTVSLFYSFTTPSGNDKAFDVEVLGMAEGGATNSGTSLVSYEIFDAGITHNELYRHDQLVTGGTITADYDLITVKVTHDGTAGKDTGTANLRFHGGYIRYHPNGRQ